MKFSKISKIIALLSIAPWILIVIYLTPIWKMLASDFNVIIEHEALYAIINITVFEPLILITTLLFIALISAQLILLFKENENINRLNVFFRIFLGGILIFPVIWFSNLLNNKVKKLPKKNKIKRVSVTSITLSSIIIPIVPIPFMQVMEMEKPSTLHEITYSLDPTEPNVIWIFIDGLSQTTIDEYNLGNIESKNLDGFYGFPNTVASGTNSEVGFKGSLGGEMHTEIGDPKSSLFVKNELYNTYDPENVMNRYLIHPTSMTPLDSTEKSRWSGDVEYVEEIFDDVNVINWSAARQVAFNNKEYGNNIYSNNMRYLGYQGVEGEASVSYIYDESIHFPFMMDEDSAYLPYFGNEESTYSGLFNNLGETFDMLRSISNGVTNAFDNSTIIINSDHGNHKYTIPESGDPGAKFISKTYMKFPNFSEGYNEFNDNSLWNPHVKNIWESYSSGEFDSNQEFENYIETNENFNIDRTSFVAIPTLSYHDVGSSGMFVKLDDDREYEYVEIYKNLEIFSINEAKNNWGESIMKETRWK